MPDLDIANPAILQSFSPTLQDAILAAPLPSLEDGPLDSALCNMLASDPPRDLVPNAAHQLDAVISGLWLLAGDIDRSHTLSQDISSREGSYLHGIMHRREGDFGNAKYWFRRVGDDHPVIDELSRVATDIHPDACAFVDAVESAKGDQVQRCQVVQWSEWQLLMSYLLT